MISHATLRKGENFECCSNNENIVKLEPKDSICLQEQFPKNGYGVLDHMCVCKDAFMEAHPGQKYINKFVNYKWNPSTCDLTDWNPFTFCKALGPRSILFVGDSTMNQSYRTLINMIRQESLIDETLIKCSEQLLFNWSDFLVHPDRQTLFQVVNSFPIRFDIIIFSAANHIHPSSEDMMKNVTDYSWYGFEFAKLHESLNNIRNLYGSF
jgi:hypothetical protein